MTLDPQCSKGQGNCASGSVKWWHVLRRAGGMRVWLFSRGSAALDRLGGPGKVRGGRHRQESRSGRARTNDNWMVMSVRGRRSQIQGEELPTKRGPRPTDLIGIICWPGMQQQGDLIPSWRVVMRHLERLGYRPLLAGYPELLRSLRLWRVRHPISSVWVTAIPTPGELRAFLTHPVDDEGQSIKKRPWSEVLKELGMNPNSGSYVRKEVAAFRQRLRAVFSDPDSEELLDLVARVEAEMADSRGRPRRPPWFGKKHDSETG